MANQAGSAEQPRAFVIGHPIAHSRSPALHGFWLEKHGICGSYTAIDVAPDGIGDFVNRIRDGEFVGGNVTLPHKEAVFALADDIHEEARALGAANTLWMADGRLNATNTDTYGFLANLDAAAKGWDSNAASTQALVVGAGGASRAIIYGLANRGFAQVLVANRTLERAENLARQFGGSDKRVKAITLADMEAVVGECTVVVNTTSLGMESHGEAAPTPDCFPAFIDKASDQTLVTDIVYTPLETPLLQRASARGLVTVDGLGMLLHQAVPGFERWFGLRPQVDEALRARVLASMGLEDGKGAP